MQGGLGTGTQRLVDGRDHGVDVGARSEAHGFGKRPVEKERDGRPRRTYGRREEPERGRLGVQYCTAERRADDEPDLPREARDGHVAPHEPGLREIGDERSLYGAVEALADG